MEKVSLNKFTQVANFDYIEEPKLILSVVRNISCKMSLSKSHAVGIHLRGICGSGRADPKRHGSIWCFAIW